MSLPDADLARSLAAEMRRRWLQGERIAAEDFLTRYPELGQHPIAALDLLYEEIRLRQEGGETEIWENMCRRFPQWQGPLRLLLECHQLLDSTPHTPRFPAPGDLVGEFQLVAELGRGARGRVFLATQSSLGHRPVVLKLSPYDSGEHLSLARLQHTSIVPLHSATEDRDRRLRVLCMPYFGGATLDRILHALTDQPAAQRTGHDLMVALDRASPSVPVPLPGAGPARRLLAGVPYVQAVCWIGACLADALQFAHERGLLHLDVKPSNVLLAADGQPMLLDFHLAHPPLRPDGPPPLELGGSLAYMPEEQRTAVEAAGSGGPVPVVVDGQADVYAFGALLYEVLGGQVPFRPGASPPLCQVNPKVSVGLSALIARCLARQPSGRYADAAAVADDLRRHLNDEPLRGVPNRSSLERWRKWQRRHPAAFRWTAILLLIMAAAVALLGGAASYVVERLEGAESALREGLVQGRERGHHAEAVETLRRGQALLTGLLFRPDMARELAEELVLAERAQLQGELRALADKVRLLDGMESVPPGEWRGVEAHCRELWAQREQLWQRLDAAHDNAVVTDLLDIALLWTDLRVRLGGTNEAAARCDALRVLADLEALCGSGEVLEEERRWHQRALGLTSGEATPRPHARTAWEHYALGRSLLRSGDLQRARTELEQALVLQPDGLWTNYYFGLCSYRLKHHEAAALAFSVCIGAAPHLAGVYYNRALASTALGRTERALQDYDRALQLDPTLAAAALNRGILHYQEKRYAQAVADLERALVQGAKPAVVHFDLALIQLAQHDRAGAMLSVRRTLEHDPNHEEARRLREQLQE